MRSSNLRRETTQKLLLLLPALNRLLLQLAVVLRNVLAGGKNANAVPKARSHASCSVQARRRQRIGSQQRQKMLQIFFKEWRCWNE